MMKKRESSGDSNQFTEEDASGNATVHGSMCVEGNLGVQGQTTTNGLKVVTSTGDIVMQATQSLVSFKKAVEFTSPVQFDNGGVIIGHETTYDSSYVGAHTVQVGDRLVVGDSAAKWDVDTRTIVADTFNMSLAKLVVDTANMKKGVADLVQAKDLQVRNELVGQTIYADTIKTNNLFMDTIASLKMTVKNGLSAKDIVANTLKVNSSIEVKGVGVNGAALTVSGGEIVANKGIVSHTRNNRFQTMEVMGSGVRHDVCFKVDKYVDSLFQGDVTVQDSKLILDNSTLATDNVVVTPISNLTSSATSDVSRGVQLTTKQDWDDYFNEMVSEYEESDSGCGCGEDCACGCNGYNPYAKVSSAMERNRANYEAASEKVKTLVNPISYAMSQCDPTLPKRFDVSDGVYRVDSNGNALLKNVVSQNGRFSKLEAYEFAINQFKVDKLTTTAVASNVVHADNLLKSTGIAELDGSVHVGADVFLEKTSKTYVGNGAKVTFQGGSSLAMKDGASIDMGANTSLKVSGDVELDVNKLVLVDSKTGIKCRITLRQAVGAEGSGVVVEYVPVYDTSASSSKMANATAMDAREIDEKLKKLGM